MSLFSLKEIWVKSPEQDSEFCPNAFCIAEVSSSILLITGNLSGSLKVFCPGIASPNDDLLEMAISAPIYQIEYGSFISGTATKQLCVLCPKSIKVFFLSYNPDDKSSSIPASLELAYEHRFERNSFNMVFGSFGQGLVGRDFICVQSIDGVLSVFEQETKGITCNVPNFLLPSALAYLPSCDTFITASYSQTISAFKYQNFASEKAAKNALKSEWQYDIGELVVDIKFAAFEHFSPSILVLGERSIFCLSDNGIVRFVKKLDCTPLCFHPYTSLSKDSINYMVATSNSNLLVLNDQKLAWTTQMPFAPIFLTTLSAKNTENCICAADSAGNIIIGYLGTDPDLKSYISRLESRQNETYEKIQQNLVEIKSSISGRELGIDQRDDSGDVLEVAVSVPSNLDSPSKAKCNNKRLSVPSITVQLSLKGKVAVTNVDVVFSPVSPVAASQNQFTFASAGGPKNDVSGADVVFYVEKDSVPSDLCVAVAASYKTTTGRSKTAHTSFTLPLNLCCSLCEPQKNQTHKLTLDFDRSPLPLPPLFSSFNTENDANMDNENAIAFKFHCNPIVTLLAASKSNRYRIQSDDFEALWLILKEFYGNMTAFMRDDKCLTFSGQVPVQELLSAIETHAQLRLNIFNLSELIGQRAVQFRVIQKRLLSKFKDKNADSLLNMDAILEGTYRQLVSLGDGAEEMEGQLVASGCKVAAIARIIIFLCKLLQNLDPHEVKFLEYVFSPSLLFSAPLDQGWEEHVDAAVTHLLKTTMSKDSREDGAQTVTLEKYPSPDKLTRHIKVFVDRILKGSCPSGATSTAARSFTSSSKSHFAPSSQAHVNGISANTITEEDEYEDTGMDMGASGDHAPRRSRNGSYEDHSRKTSSGGLEHFESLHEET